VTAGSRTLPAGPFAGLVGLEPIQAGDGRAVLELALRDDHLNPYGVVHGGAVYTLVDTAMGAALVTRLEPGERCATLEIKINYLAPVRTGRLTCHAALVERTRRIAVLEARVENGGPQTVALATGSFYISRDPA
jgi:acyl-CoA thioesterase